MKVARTIIGHLGLLAEFSVHRVLGRRAPGWTAGDAASPDAPRA